MPANKFYDIHFHAMDLSHANITAFLNRFIEEHSDLLNTKLIEKTLRKNMPRWQLLLLPFIPYSVLSRKIFKGVHQYIKEEEFVQKTQNARNLLAYMENSIQYDFLVVDYFLKKSGMVQEDNTFQAADHTYDKMVLCPLIMDFGHKSMNLEGIHYNIPPQKPVARQIRDLFSAIHFYYHNDISIKKPHGRVKFKISPSKTAKTGKLFEIYPFMGINTQNYTYGEVDEMLQKYFHEFSGDDTPEERRAALYSKMGEFDGNLDDSAQTANIFAGVKLYPPLGFAPWPDNQQEREKAELLYATCVEKNIPLTVHASAGGFVITNHAREYTDPGAQWAKVLKQYPGLKINFAHFGAGSEQWQQTIIEYINSGARNVYTDFSCNTEHDAYYEKLHKTLQQNNGKLAERILFGSDFMINLLWLKSYDEYLNYFMQTSHLSNELKHRFSNTNAEAFLFGTDEKAPA